MKLCYPLPLTLFALSFTNQCFCNAHQQIDEVTNTSSTIAAAIGNDGDHEGRYIVKFKSTSQFQTADYQLQNGNDSTNSIHIMTLPQERAEVMTLQSEKEVQYWNNRDDVEYVEPDHKVYLQQSSEEITPWGIKYVKALNVSDGPVSNQKVCIIDSGYDRSHPDLPSSSSIVTGDSFSNDPSHSWWIDQFGHGTHVAGTIAAIGDNGRGVNGVIRNGQVKLHIVKVFGELVPDQDGTPRPLWIWTSNLIDAAEKCVEAGSTVINMSFASLNFSQPLNDAFDRIFNQNNVLLVAASGNMGNSFYSYPASYPSVISVASIDNSKSRSYFSQFNDQVDLAAPGSRVTSTIPGGGYGDKWGTSMAAPHVSGVAALVWSHFPTKTAKEIRQALEASAEDLGPTGRDDQYGHGLVRADLAYNMLSEGGGSSLSNYVFHPFMNSAGNNIRYQLGGLEAVARACSSDPRCKGFNSNGWMKHTVMDQSRWTKWTSNPSKGFYVKNQSTPPPPTGGDLYVLQDAKCDPGFDVPRNECFEAALSVGKNFPRLVKGKMFTGLWSYTPCGCFIWKVRGKKLRIDYHANPSEGLCGRNPNLRNIVGHVCRPNK